MIPIQFKLKLVFLYMFTCLILKRLSWHNILRLDLYTEKNKFEVVESKRDDVKLKTSMLIYVPIFAYNNISEVSSHIF